MPASSPTRRRNLLLTSSLLTLSLLAPPAHAQGTAWPRQFLSTSGKFIIYQPQPEQLTGNLITARLAFSLQKSTAPAPTFGVMWFQAHVQVDRDSSTVSETDLDVTRVRLPGASEEDESRYEHLVEAEAAGWDLSGSLPELQAGLAASAKERLDVQTLEHTPPRVLFSTQRALLVPYDGEPQLEPIEGSRLKRVANTPYAVVFDSVATTYWLSGANLWYRASDPLGPWSVAAAPPAAVAAVVPPDTSAADLVSGPAPVVVTATEPTELIVTDGEPQLEPLVGTELFYVSNTESDVLRDVKTGSVYVLLSGRWYTAHALDDPWVYLPADQLPEIFQRIPVESPKGHLLASVAGTDQADDALADDEIPQTSVVARTDHGIVVMWDGAPQFDQIPNSYLRYGVNTDSEVLLSEQRYYLCEQGVWYVADEPTGPWIVSTVRPIGLDDLTPACPVYNLRYVDIYGFTPDLVEVGYLPGYLGYYSCNGTVVYGTGYRYRSWRGPGHYFPRPCTWGSDARYNPWLSRWSFGVSYWSGFLRVGFRWQQSFGSGQPRRTPPWFGPGGFHRPLLAMDRTMLRTQPARMKPRTIDTNPLNIYTRTANARRLAKPLGRPGFVGKGLNARIPDDVFAGRDGNVYQRGTNGQWNVNEGGRWKPAPVPATPPQPLSLPGGGGASGPNGSGVKPLVVPVPVTPVSPVEPITPDREPHAAPPVPMPVVRVPVDPAPVAAPPKPAPVRTPAAEPAPSAAELDRALRARERVSHPPREVEPRPAAPAPRPEAPAPRPAAPARKEPEPARQEHGQDKPDRQDGKDAPPKREK